MSAKWNSEQIPDQHGRTAIVTGAISGLGLATARDPWRATARASCPGLSAMLRTCVNAPEGAVDIDL